VIVLGVDPGKHGGLAFLVPGASLHVVPMPILTAAKGGRDEYDVAAIVHLVDRQLDYAAHHLDGNDSVRAFLERLQPMPMEKGGTIANFQRGYATALFVGIFAALGVPCMLVVPRVWQKAMLEGTSGSDTKQRSIVAASRLFPGVSFLPTPKSRKPSDGLTDAALLAEYGRRKLAGDQGAQRGMLEARA
jgi:hypothetical protein